MKIGNYEIPFDSKGNQLDYPERVHEMRPNFVFEDTLAYQTYGRGRSSITFTMVRKSNLTTVSVFASDLHLMLPLMAHGLLKGKFTFVKKGQNYGCKLLEVLP